MRNNHKFITLTFLTTVAGGVIYIINKMISIGSTINEILEKPKNNSFFNWRFGNIYYTKKGSGKPVLLVHDVTPGSSGYEWHKIENKLSENHTVYTIDLLGCGRSDKPAMTYTSFIYSQLILDFTREIIGQKTDLIATGLSCSSVITACNLDKDQFDQCMLINPTNICRLNMIPNQKSKTQKFLIELPVIGTLLYNIFISMFHVEHLFMEDYFFNPFHMDQNYMRAYYESAHLGESKGKYLYASLAGRYLNFNISHNLKSITNSIYLVGGEHEPEIMDIINNYKKYNPSIEHAFIEKTKHYPHIERPAEFLDLMEIYLNEKY